MNKTRLAIFAGVAAAVAAVSLLVAQAQTAALTVSCSGSVSGNQVTWMATSTGGNAPYAFLWSGDPSVAGQTSDSFVETYTTNGTYSAGIQATDASSSIATSTCAATITANAAPATTSTLNVIVSVNNTQGGAATPSNFTVSVSGANASPSSFAGSDTGTAVVVTGGTGYSVSASSVANYSMSTSGNCSGPITAGGADACTITEAYVPPTTATSTLPRVNPPSLSIGTNGSFLARGMTVTSVGTNSFQAEVWGITYTINWSGNLYPQFYFRNGNGGNATSSPTMQIAVGDEVGVAGKVASANPLVVTATTVRDYSIMQPRPRSTPFQYGNGNGNHGNNSSSVNADIGTRISDLMNQLHGLQNLFKSFQGGR